MKKVWLFVIIAALCISLCACVDSGGQSDVVQESSGLSSVEVSAGSGESGGSSVADAVNSNVGNEDSATNNTSASFEDYPNFPEIDVENFKKAASITADDLLKLNADDDVEKVMSALKTTVHTLAQGPTFAYYIIDGVQVKMFFYPADDGTKKAVCRFSGAEMKENFEKFGVVTYAYIHEDKVKKIEPGMTFEQIIETLGATVVEDGDGYQTGTYIVKSGMIIHTMVLTSSGGEIPYSGDEIMIKLFENGMEPIEW